MKRVSLCQQRCVLCRPHYSHSTRCPHNHDVLWFLYCALLTCGWHDLTLFLLECLLPRVLSHGPTFIPRFMFLICWRSQVVATTRCGRPRVPINQRLSSCGLLAAMVSFRTFDIKGVMGRALKRRHSGSAASQGSSTGDKDHPSSPHTVGTPCHV